MNGGIVALILAGFIGFGAGAYIAATGERSVGIALMAMGLVFQVLALRQIRTLKKTGFNDMANAGHGERGDRP